MRRQWLLSIGAVALAIIGSQHHNLMMLLFALGLGDATMSAMTAVPFVRNVMLALSVVMAAVIAYQIARPRAVLWLRASRVRSRSS
jgi:hypothetical protein